jgi:hypothetical protein
VGTPLQEKSIKERENQQKVDEILREMNALWVEGSGHFLKIVHFQ